MGLLDEAIREHLELKRRRGADPTAVARQEWEALAPTLPAEHGAPDGDDGYSGHEPQDAAHEEMPLQAGVVEDASDGGSGLGDLSGAGQETAELDMQAVLDEDGDASDGTSPVGLIADSPTRAVDPGEMPVEHSLEWEVAGERDGESLAGEVAGEGDGESLAEDVPGQERLSFD